MSDKTTPRASLDGQQDRAQVYALLETFDHHGMAPDVFAGQAIALLGVAGVTDAESLHAACVDQAQVTAGACGPPPPSEAVPDDSRDATIRAADAVMAHQFDFYGEVHQLPAVIDFEYNPGTRHWGHDLNRFTYLTPLVRAHGLSGDAKYADKALALILHWIDTTDVADAFPPGGSPHVWSSYLNIAIHLQAWSRAIAQLLRQAPAHVPPADLLRIAKSVHDQLQYLDLVIPEARNNWISIGTMGQLVTMQHWPSFACEPELAGRAYQRLQDSVSGQLWPDGAQKELTISYHCVVMRNIMAALRAHPFVDAPEPAALRDQLRAMLLYARHLLTPDGMLAGFNDSDAAHGQSLQTLLDDPISRELLGPAADEPLTSRCFPYAGLMTLRQGSRCGADELYLAFDGGPFGMSHQHEDKLGLWLSAYGRSLLIDSGRHLYDSSAASYRDYVSSTAAHSTICIDGHGQNSRAHRHTWFPDHEQPVDWAISDTDAIRAAADYTLGYGPDAIPVAHRRIIEFDPDARYWVITDELTRDDADHSIEHLIESRFQFAPDAAPQIAPGVVYSTFPDANLAIYIYPGEWQDIRIDCGAEDPRGGWISLRYNHITPAPRLTLSWRGVLPARRRYILMPFRGSDLPTRPE